MRKVMLLLLFGVILDARVLLACSCNGPSPGPCAGLKPSDVVFVGTVESVEEPPVEGEGNGEGVQLNGLVRYRFRIDEKISGVESTEIEILSGRGGGDCGYRFEAGRQYLVFPFKGRDGALIATICSDTRPIELAQAKLDELRAMRDHGPVASLYGSLLSTERPYDPLDGFELHLGKLLANTTVLLRSEMGTFESKTDDNGSYAFYHLPAGKYRIDADLPKTQVVATPSTGEEDRSIDLPSGACFQHDVRVLPTGRISGKLVGADGKAVAFAFVRLYRADRYPNREGWIGWSASEGEEADEFVFENISAGDYILIYDRRGGREPGTPYPELFYPGALDVKQAQIVHLDEGQEIRDLEFKVPPAR